MEKIFIVTVLAIAVFNASAQQADSLKQPKIMMADQMKIKDLVRAARLDDLVILGIPSVFFPRHLPTDPEFLKATACIAAKRNPGFVELLAHAVEKTMSPDELKSGHLFFNSDTGRKYAELMVWQARDELAYKQSSSRPQLSSFEEETARKFLMSPAGSKLTTRHLFAISQTAVRILELGADIVAACSAKTQK